MSEGWRRRLLALLHHAREEQVAPVRGTCLGSVSEVSPERLCLWSVSGGGKSHSSNTTRSHLSATPRLSLGYLSATSRLSLGYLSANRTRQTRRAAAPPSSASRTASPPPPSPSQPRRASLARGRSSPEESTPLKGNHHQLVSPSRVVAARRGDRERRALKQRPRLRQQLLAEHLWDMCMHMPLTSPDISVSSQRGTEVGTTSRSRPVLDGDGASPPPARPICSPPPARSSIACSSGRRYASVFPEPASETRIASAPPARCGHASRWISSGAVKGRAAESSCRSPSSAKVRTSPAAAGSPRWSMRGEVSRTVLQIDGYRGRGT